MDADQMTTVINKLKELDDPKILESLEMSVNLDVVMGGESMRWLTMQAKPEVLAAFIKTLLPAMEQISSVMRAAAKVAKG